ncbi:MAG TPA: glycine--tRNA ligase subunit beta [Elusimicrobia bacterium]|nr:glycine--tRNA ligase subunit beta [Elusimicrobiota bacterium]
MKNALLEIGVESLPARFVPPALRQMERLALELLKAERLPHGAIRVFGTPMRLALVIEDVQDRSEAAVREASGPPARLLKDAQGAFTPQALGFAKAQGVKPEELETKTTPKGEVLCARKTLPGEGAPKVLERVFPALVAGIEFPKTLEWEESRFRFGRPIRTLVALLGGKVVPFQLAGVQSGARTRGLAALGYPSVPLTPEGYLQTLRDACVLADPAERRAAMLEGLRKAAGASSGRLDEDEALVEQVVNLCEHPVPVLGHFDKAFLELPQSLLTTVLKTQLRFFPLLGRDGRLAAEFIGVRDGVSEGQKDVQDGYQRVLSARFSDARFFFRRDRESTLEQKRAKLALVGFQKGLGSMLDKSERILGVVRWLCERLRQEVSFDEAAAQALARLCHCDLVADVVKEFPELQGTMGGVYARAEGLGERVSLGLEEFYFPTQAKGPLPAHLEGALASLAGKLDTVCALFSAGLKPTGSEDPFALRRLGNGVVRILLEKQVRVRASEIVDAAFAQLEAQKLAAGADLARARAEVLEFLWQRAESLFLDQGFKADEVRSVKEGGLDDLPRTYKRLSAVRALRPEPDFAALAQAFKRAANIFTKEAPSGGRAEVQKLLLKEEAERALFEALCRVESEVRSKSAAEEFEPALRALVSLKPQLDAFFDDVHVMDEDKALQGNRLALLGRLVGLFRSVADVSQVQS